MKERVIDLLRSTGRPGVDKLIVAMDEGGFFTAPCSGAYHLAKEGGLLEHSLNVFYQMDELAKAWGDDIPGVTRANVVICALLHDLGKMGDYNKPNYVPNMIKSKKKDENGEYPLIQSEAKPYETNSELAYVPHEVRSVSIASKYIELTEEEYFAILHHNGMYSDMKYALNGKERPLQMLLHFADLWCSRVTEKEEK